MKKVVPFYSQHWDLNDWQRLGFESFDDAQYWERSACGVLCLKMAADSFLVSASKPLLPEISDCIRKGVEIDAYTDATGWSHDGLTRLAGHFGFTAHRRERVDVEGLCEAIDQGFLPIVSIKWAFLDHKSLKERVFFWKKFGGHLAVVVGYEKDGDAVTGLYVHHTSKIREQNWEYGLVPVEKFRNCFTGRCILIKPEDV